MPRVLVVEDDLAIGRAVQTELIANGHEVIWAQIGCRRNISPITSFAPRLFIYGRTNPLGRIESYLPDGLSATAPARCAGGLGR